MITAVDVIRAFSGLLEATLGDPPVTKDVIEKADRPCSYLRPTSLERERVGDLYHDTVDLEISYFAPFSHRGYLDLIQTQNALTEALSREVEVEEAFHLLPEEIDFTPYREDMVLVGTFTVEYFQAAETSAAQETMDILVLDDGTEYYEEE